MHKTERALLALVLLAYLITAGLYAIRTPPWQAPDEPAHYNYIAQVAGSGCCPVIEPGDWDSPYLERLKSARFHPDTLDNLSAIQYEDHQPPLYYLIGALVFRLTDGSLIALRLLSVVLGAGVVICAYAVGKLMLPRRPQIALGAALFVAFIPQHTAILAAVSNDALAELIVGLGLVGIVRYLRDGSPPAWALGLLVGAGFLTKASTFFLAGLVPLAILLRGWALSNRRARDLLLAWAAFLAPALILGAVWWGRNLSVYGFPDLFGLARHDLVVTDQLRTADLIAQIGANAYLQRAVSDTFNSFWGQFGWMALPLPSWAYTLIALFLLLAAVGAVIGWLLDRRSPEPALQDAADSRWKRLAWLALALTVILGVAQYVYYNSEFVQFQGRYLYPTLIPLGIGLAIGIDGWRRLIARGVDRRKRLPAFRWLTVAAMALLIPFNLYFVWRVIPLLAP